MPTQILNITTVLQLYDLLQADWESVLQGMVDKFAALQDELFSELNSDIFSEDTIKERLKYNSDELLNLALNLRYLTPMLENVQLKILTQKAESYVELDSSNIVRLEGFSTFLELLVETKVNIELQLEQTHISLARAILNNNSTVYLEQHRKLISAIQIINDFLPTLQNQLQQTYCECVVHNYTNAVKTNNKRVTRLDKQSSKLANKIGKLKLLSNTKNTQRKITKYELNLSITIQQLQMQRDLFIKLPRDSIKTQQFQNAIYHIKKIIDDNLNDSEDNDLFQNIYIFLQKQQDTLRTQGEEIIVDAERLNNILSNSTAEMEQYEAYIDGLTHNLENLDQHIDECQEKWQESTTKRDRCIEQYNQNINAGNYYLTEHNRYVDDMNALGTESFVFSCPILPVALEHAPRYTALLQLQDEVLQHIHTIDGFQYELLEQKNYEDEYIQELSEAHDEYVAEMEELSDEKQKFVNKYNDSTDRNRELQNDLLDIEKGINNKQQELDHNIYLQCMLQYLDTIDNSVIEQLQILDQISSIDVEQGMEELAAVRSEAISHALRNIALSEDEFYNSISIMGTVNNTPLDKQDFYTLQRNYVYIDIGLQDVAELMSSSFKEDNVVPLEFNENDIDPDQINDDEVDPALVDEVHTLQEDIAETTYIKMHANYMLEYMEHGPAYYKLKIARNNLSTASRNANSTIQEVELLEQESTRLHAEYDILKQKHIKCHAVSNNRLEQLLKNQQLLFNTKIAALSPPQTIRLSNIITNMNAAHNSTASSKNPIISEHQQAQQQFKQKLIELKTNNTPQNWQKFRTVIEHAHTVHSRYVEHESIIKRSILRAGLNANFAKRCALYQHPFINHVPLCYAKRTRDIFNVIATQKLKLSAQAFNRPEPLHAAEAAEIDNWSADLQKFLQSIVKTHKRIMAEMTAAEVKHLFEGQLSDLDSGDNALYDHFKLDDFAAIIKELRGIVITDNNNKIYDHIGKKFVQNLKALNKVLATCAEIQRIVREELTKRNVPTARKQSMYRLIDCLQRRIVLQQRIIKSFDTRLTAVQQLHVSQGIAGKIHLSANKSQPASHRADHPEVADQGGEHGTGVCKQVHTHHFSQKPPTFKSSISAHTSLPSSSTTFVRPIRTVRPVQHTPHIEQKKSTRFGIRMPIFKPSVRPITTILHPVLRHNSKLFTPKFNAIKAKLMLPPFIKPSRSTPVIRQFSAVRSAPVASTVQRIIVPPRVNLNTIRQSTSARSSARVVARPVIFRTTTRNVAVRAMPLRSAPPPARRAPPVARPSAPARSARTVQAARRGLVRQCTNGGAG